MICKNHVFTVDSIVERYKKELRMEGIDDYSSLIFYSPIKKDVNKDGDTREFFVNLDNIVRELIKEDNIKNGVAVCSSMHTTSSVYINHFETGIMTDELELLQDLYPVKKYKHNEWDNEYKNGDAHLKAMHMGKNCVVIIENGNLVLGDFENVIYGEFDYRAGKSLSITLMGETND